jgi:hypothetical protein
MEDGILTSSDETRIVSLLFCDAVVPFVTIFDVVNSQFFTTKAPLSPATDRYDLFDAAPLVRYII